jgi:SAM-dependent methyltransferase
VVASGYEKTLPPSYFEDKYRADIDPWQFRSSPYERQKYEATVGALTKAQYRRALEVGCSIGIFTALLSPRCRQLVAIDSSQTALAEAKQQNLPNVRFERAVLPDDFPNGNFDLIVLSEVLYYFVEADLIRLAEKCGMSLDAGGEIILCHWLGETDYPLTGYHASDLFMESLSTRRPTRVILHEAIYRLERISFAREGVDAER